MIDRHHTSRSRRLIGSVFCACLGLLAVTSGPTSLAQDDLDELLPPTRDERFFTPVYESTPLPLVIDAIADAISVNMLMAPDVYRGAVTWRASSPMSARQLLTALSELLGCYGAKLERDAGGNFVRVVRAEDARSSRDCPSAEAAR